MYPWPAGSVCLPFLCQMCIRDRYKRTKIKFGYQGIDYNYQDVQPVNVVYGRYLNAVSYTHLWCTVIKAGASSYDIKVWK